MNEQIGLIGAGNMAGALVKGLIASGTLDQQRIVVSDIDQGRVDGLAQAYGIRGATTPELVAQSDVIVVAVKPQSLVPVLEQIGPQLGPKKLLVSIVAGAPSTLFAMYAAPGTRMVRAMPNTPALVLAGATGIARGPNATRSDLELAVRLFEAVGKTVTLDESQMDAVTGLSGSGPAYVMMIIEALADGGVCMGLPRATALTLAAQTVYGAARLHLETGEHPGVLKDRVTSPGGTTIAGVHALESGGLRRALIDAVVAATRRANELGKS